MNIQVLQQDKQLERASPKEREQEEEREEDLRTMKGLRGKYTELKSYTTKYVENQELKQNGTMFLTSTFIHFLSIHCQKTNKI